MKWVIAMGLLASLFGCSDGRPVGMSDDDISRAALKIAYPLPSCLQSWIGGTVEQCDRAQERLNQRRKEYENFEPAWMRKAIMHWFDYSQREINEARKDCITGESRRKQEEYSVRTKAEGERAQAILRSIGR